MGLPAKKLSPAEFLAWENEQELRHEFYRGEVFAMVGARRVHGLVVLNLATALKGHLKGMRCRAFVESMKLQLADDTFFYPDVFVTCDEQDLKTDMIFRHPSLVVEVLSESTQAFDRGLKFAAYRQLASLREYLLVDPATRSVEVFRRNERGNFELIDQTGAAQLVLDSVSLALPMDEVFDGVEALGSDEGATG
jgi:Uma2 family endonuclease